MPKQTRAREGLGGRKAAADRAGKGLTAGKDLTARQESGVQMRLRDEGDRALGGGGWPGHQDWVSPGRQGAPARGEQGRAWGLLPEGSEGCWVAW